MGLAMVGTDNHRHGPRAGGKPTIDDVARQAGVSRTTVSRVLNNGANVRPVVRETVMEAVAQLGFKANVQARTLAGRSGGSLALVHQSDLDTEPNSYYHAALELGALRACADGGFQVLTRTVSSGGALARRQIEDMFSEGQVAGIILTPPLSDDPQLRDLAATSGYAIVFVSPDPATEPNGPAFGINDFAAGRDIARYLIELGHRRFGYIHGLEDHPSAERRFAGLRAALDEAGLLDVTPIEEWGTFTFKSGIECAERILAQAVLPTALMCANDDMAAGALLALHRAGLDIPKDISVTGFDSTPISEIMWPPLTTVLQPIKQIGHDAASLLIDMIVGSSVTQPATRPFAEHLVIVRDSTAPPRHT
jgi:LacI family transcriptional regulator